MSELRKISEIAGELRVSEETIRRWIRAGKIDYVAVGPFGAKRVRATDIVKEHSNVQPRTSAIPNGTKEEGTGTDIASSGQSKTLT